MPIYNNNLLYVHGWFCFFDTEETISIPDRLLQNDSDPHSFVTIKPVLENFPDPSSVTVYYATESQQKLGPYDVSMSHVLLVDSERLERVTALAADPYGYKAQCSFNVLKGKWKIYFSWAGFQTLQEAGLAFLRICGS